MCCLCVWDMHTGMCRYMYALQRLRRTSDVLLYQAWLCSLETGTLIETGSRLAACKLQ